MDKISNEKQDEVISKTPNAECIKCDRTGTLEIIKIAENTHKEPKMYGRIIHGKNDICHLGEYWGSYEDVLRRYSEPDQKRMKDKKPTTVEAYEALIEDIIRVSKILDQPRYKSVRSAILHRLFFMLPVNSHKSKEWQLQQYAQIIDNIVKVVRSLDDKKYAYSGRSLKPEFVKVLKNGGVWKDYD